MFADAINDASKANDAIQISTTLTYKEPPRHKRGSFHLSFRTFNIFSLFNFSLFTIHFFVVPLWSKWMLER